jgi:hypothetical protein
MSLKIDLLLRLKATRTLCEIKIGDLWREYASLPRQLIFHFLLRSSLFTASCVRTITELIIVEFRIEHPKTKTTFRTPIDIARHILVYETSPQHSNLIFQLMFVQIRNKIWTRFVFLSSMRDQVTQKDLSLTFCPWFSTMDAKSIRTMWAVWSLCLTLSLMGYFVDRDHLLLFVSCFPID